MISYEDPPRVPWGPAENQRQSEEFLWVLHGFLLLYLALHNFVIPVGVNLYRGNPLLEDAHFWFLAQFPLALALRRRSAHADVLMTMVALGSGLRLVWETWTLAPAGPTWGLFSIWLSEGSSAILYAYYFTRHGRVPKFGWRWSWIPLLALALTQVEERGELFRRPLDFVRTVKRDLTWADMGCRGSRIVWNGLAESAPGDIQSCGFSRPMADLGAPLVNGSRATVQVRVARLRLHGGELKRDFVRLLILRPGQSARLPGGEGDLLVLSSIQQKWLGIQLRVGSQAGARFPRGLYRIDPYESEFLAETP